MIKITAPSFTIKHLLTDSAGGWKRDYSAARRAKTCY
jgi:hypothetical protein